MNMKKSSLLALAAISTLAITAGAAMAFGGHGAYGGFGNCGAAGNNANYPTLTDEQKTAATKIYEESGMRMMPMVEQLDAKNLELKVLSKNPNTQPETLSKLVQEVSALRSQLNKENLDRRNKLNAAGLPMGGDNCPMMSERGEYGHGGNHQGRGNYDGRGHYEGRGGRGGHGGHGMNR